MNVRFGAKAPALPEIYKIRRTSDNLYSRGGMDAHRGDYSWNKNGKEWKKGPLVNHLLQYDGQYSRTIPDNWVVERYVNLQIKVDEVPAKELMKDRFAKRTVDQSDRQAALVASRIHQLQTELAALRAQQ